MKKFISIVLALSLVLCALAYSEEAPAATTPAELEEGQMYFHGYISEIGNYYVGVPQEWAPIGANSPAAYIEQAEAFMDYYTVRDIISSVNAQNDVLVAAAPTGESLVLIYGPSEGTTNESLINNMESYQETLLLSHPGIQLTEDSGSFKVTELSSVLRISAVYMNHKVDQFYLAAGTQLFIFTFIDTDIDVAQAVLTTFQLL